MEIEAAASQAAGTIMPQIAAPSAGPNDTRAFSFRAAREQHKPWNPDANRQNFTAWCSAMNAGNFDQAWAINDLARQHWPSAHQLWTGKPFEGSAIALEARHGLGDFVQMMRFIPSLNRLGCAVSINVRPELQALADHFSGEFMINVCDRASNADTIEMMELPYAFRLRTSHLPVLKKYLYLPTDLTAQKRLHMNPTSRLPKVGIVWSGSSWDPERWIPFDHLTPLLQMNSCEWWSMQGVLSGTSDSHRRLRTVAEDRGRSLVDLATAIENLDLLITVDTLAAHIAGALGKEVWLLLKKRADWRWMQDRLDSPWYPSARLFRQSNCGDWKSVVSAVKTALDRRLSP